MLLLTHSQYKYRLCCRFVFSAILTVNGNTVTVDSNTVTVDGQSNRCMVVEVGSVIM